MYCSLLLSTAIKLSMYQQAAIHCQKCIAACCANIPLTIDRYFGLSIADIPFDDDVTEFPEAADSSHVSRLFRHRLLALSIEALRQRTAAHHLVTHL
jgi:Fe-S-cluster containining protein